jgi:dipeptidyl aminopeptidase/acylaminoacyl peptidase
MALASRSSVTLYPARNAGGRTLTAEDLWGVPRVGAPSAAPDGSWAVVPVTRYDLEKNEGKSVLWRVSADAGTDPRALTSADLSSTAPRVSPDGSRIAFVRRRDKTEKPQLYVLPLEGGEAEKLTDLPLGVMDPRWFPDGKRIAFLSSLLKSRLTIEATKKRLEEREQDPVKAHVTEDRVYRFWDTWLDGGEVPHLFVLDLETRALTDLTPDSERWFDWQDPEGAYDIRPDGAEIAFSACVSEPPYRLLRWAIFTVPASGGATTCLTPDHPADDLRPRYTPDGKAIVYGMTVDPFFYADRVRLMRYDRERGEHRTLTETWDRSPSGWEIDADGRIVFLAEDDGRTHVFSLPESGGTPSLVAQGGTLACLTLGGARAFFTRQTMSDPPELWSADLRASDTATGQGGPRTLTRFAVPALEAIALGEVRELRVEGARGDRVQVYLVLPPGFDASKKWPLVHVIHGGPHAASADAFHFRWNAQWFASHGYVVAMVNFHGSTSWGQEFAQCIQGLWGELPMIDIERATDALLGEGYVDERRMAITGGSYGGYLVSWIGSHTDRYACIVNHAGVYNTQAQYASDVTQGRHKAFGGEPWDGLEKIDRWNPSRFAHGCNTPTLVIHGECDFRVPVDQGLECYNVLQGKGVPSRLVYFPDENHWILKPKNSLFWHREVKDWLARFLGAKP